MLKGLRIAQTMTAHAMKKDEPTWTLRSTSENEHFGVCTIETPDADRA
jgi:hypothetical protein